MCPLSMQTAYFTLRELSCIWTISWCLDKKWYCSSPQKRDKKLVKKLSTGAFIANLWKTVGKTYLICSFIDTRNIFSIHQSGFRISNSCVHQLISIVHDIYNAFDANPSLEVRAISLKHLIGCGIKVYYIKLNACVYMEIFLN